jgi:cell division protein FtsB
MEEGLKKQERPSRQDVWTDRLATGWLFWPACLLGVALVGLAVLGPEAEANLSVKRQAADMKAEVDALAKTRDQDVAIERALREDPETIERMARHEIGVVRPGEIRLPQRVRPVLSTDAPGSVEPDVPPALRMLAMFGDPMLRFTTMVVGVAILFSITLLSLPGRKPKAQTVKA